MWGLGASLGPYIMGYVLTRGESWNMGYRVIGILQVALTMVLVFSLPLWKKRPVAVGEAGEKEAEAVSLETVDHKAKSTINISNCLDIEKGTVTVSVENVGQDDQTINIDIDGEVYTTGARTKVWSGVCAISSFENGSESTLLQYTNEGEQTGDVENSVANTNGIMLMWPGAASTAQTIAGMVMEFRILSVRTDGDS